MNNKFINESQYNALCFKIKMMIFIIRIGILISVLECVKCRNSPSIDYQNSDFAVMKYDKVQLKIEHDQDDDNKRINRNHILMLSPNTQSNIKFSPALRNADAKIYKLLQELYEKLKDINQILPILCQKRVNPQIAQVLTQRDDLEYYVPQLVTYMVVQCNLQNQQLNQLLVRACMTDFYFAHSVYFYLQSLSKNEEGIPITKVADFIQNVFLPKMKLYERRHLSGHQLTRHMIGRKSSHTHQYQKFQESQQKMNINDEEFIYGTKQYPDPAPDFPTPVTKVRLKTQKDDNIGFMETPKFWMDLVLVGQKLASYPPVARSEALSNLLKQQINTRLPATVYIPFFTQMTRMYTILNVWDGRVFSTKERAPFSLWVELYREQEQQMKQIIQDLQAQQLQQQMGKKNKNKNKHQSVLQKIYQTLSKPFTIADGKNTLKIKNFVMENKSKMQEAIKKRVRFQSFYEKYENQEGTSTRPLSLSVVYQNKSDGRSIRSQASEASESDKQQNMVKQSLSDQIFSTSSVDVIADFKKKSIYRNLKSWRIMHLMVKIGDDLRQQQFAMQLIGKIQYIFQKQKVDCILKPYEVISLGPNYGLIEMLNDVTTLDSLFRKLGPMAMTLGDFFQKNYKNNLIQAKQNFLKSLAGYSLVTYFLQVKDRHNGNIMLHRDGCIIHIDFGFFLSNAPGKGVELQKNCPFKLLTAYVQVLGTTNSEMFFQFRRLFYKGFSAIIKNKDMILSIVKMMYKSHGDMMNCFIKGQRAIQQLQIRLNPQGNVQNFCYNLINNSLDNWRAKWYDKFQYFLQKIYY